MKNPLATVCIICIAIVGYMGGQGDGARILILTPLGSKSHKNFLMGITEALAEAGHHVTMVSTHKPPKEKENIREVVLSANDVVFYLNEIFDKSKQVSSAKKLMLSSPEICIESLSDVEIQKLKKEKFDLVILSMFANYCYVSLAHHFQAPLIHASPAGLVGPIPRMVGNVQFSSLQKNELLDEVHFPYSFFTRFKTILLDTLIIAFNDLYLFPRSNKLCREAGLCPPDMPTLKEISDNASLILISSVKSLESPLKPTMPNVIYVGGIHCHPPNPLPKELEDWVSTADDGFIFFSLGSAIKTKDLPENHRKILLNVFGSLKQKVLWKWDQEDMDDLPPNVRLGKWLPQQDLLGHEKMKLFITHGGLLSTLEASYHSVPIIGMPVSVDQFSNIAGSVSEGWAAQMYWEDLNEQSLRQLILHVIGNQKFNKVVRQRSKLMRDLPRSPAQEAVYWIEYVLRHDGAQHIKSPVLKLYTYELYSMDVWAFIAVVLLFFCFLILSCFKFFLRRCFKKKSHVSKKKKE